MRAHVLLSNFREDVVIKEYPSINVRLLTFTEAKALTKLPDCLVYTKIASKHYVELVLGETVVKRWELTDQEVSKYTEIIEDGV